MFSLFLQKLCLALFAVFFVVLATAKPDFSMGQCVKDCLDHDGKYFTEAGCQLQCKELLRA
jgi:hypothetical protein